MKTALGVITIMVALVILIFISFRIEIPYHVSGRGVIMPLQEWSLYRGSGGSLVHMHENHLSGIVSEYGISEVQRGDIARYHFNSQLLNSGKVQQGDTIARLYTSDIYLKIIELEGELAYQQSLLTSYLAGEKPEEIRVAENEIELAKQELENQQNQTARIVSLFDEGVVSQQEYELSVNELKVKEYALDIARSRYLTLTSGRKSEDLKATESRISSIEQQLKQTKKHMEAFHLISPLSGMIIRERNPVMENTAEVIVRIADLSSLVILVPVDYNQEPYLLPGQAVKISPVSGRQEYIGKLVSIDRTVRLINNRPKVFLTILLDDETENNLYRNSMVSASIDTGPTSVWQYLVRKANVVYQN